MTVSPDSDFFPVWKDARGWDDVLDVPVLAVRVDGLVAADVPDSTVPVLVDVPDLILFPDVCFRCSVLGSVLCSGCCYCYFSGGCLFPLCCRFLTVAGGFHFPVEVVADEAQFVESKRDAAAAAGRSVGEFQAPAETGGNTMSFEEVEDDELPF